MPAFRITVRSPFTVMSVGALRVVLVELDPDHLQEPRKEPDRAAEPQDLKAAGLSAFDKRRALELLSAAGVISVQHRAGKAPLVTHSWFPIQN